jgi:hypothetical protein
MSGTHVADGTHHTFTQSSLTVKNLTHRGSKACNSYVEVRVTEEIAFFTLASDANRLPTRRFLRGPKRWKSLSLRSELRGVGSMAVDAWRRKRSLSPAGSKYALCRAKDTFKSDIRNEFHSRLQKIFLFSKASIQGFLSVVFGGYWRLLPRK